MQTPKPPTQPARSLAHRQPAALLAALLPPQCAATVPLPPMLTRHQTLAVLGMGTSKLYELIRRGELPPCVHVGRSARWPVEEIASVRESFVAGESANERRLRVRQLLDARRVGGAK